MIRFSAQLSSVLIGVLLAPATVRFAAAIDSQWGAQSDHSSCGGSRRG